MSTLWVAFLLLAADPVEGTANTDPAASRTTIAVPTPAPEAPRTGYELRDAIRSALRRWARPSDADAPQAARDFLGLYQELQADTQLARSQKEQLRTQVRSRLAQLSEQISLRIAHQRRLANSQRPKNVKAPADKAGMLAQQWGAFGAAGRARGNPGAGMGGGFGPAGAGGRGMIPDAGQDLVDLIQTVIAPKSWDVNGGLGSIYYWQPGHALVIRQTDEVHEQIGGVLEQMGRLGR